MNRHTPIWIVAVLLLFSFLGNGARLHAQDITLSKDNALAEASAQQAELGDGKIQIVLQWDNSDDMDLWLTEPNGNQIFFGKPTSPTGGKLDRDAQRNCQFTPGSVENIHYPYGKQPLFGIYTVQVKLYRDCEPTIAKWTMWILVRGRIVQFWEGTNTAFQTQFNYQQLLSIQHVEMTQVIQNDDNTVPLIAGKRTLARVYATCNDPCPTAAINGVTARLEMDGQNITAGPLAVAPVEDWRARRGALDATFNFDLPGPTLGTRNFVFKLEMPAAGGGIEIIDQKAYDFQFRLASTLDVLVVPVQVGGVLPTGNFVQNALNRTRFMFPVHAAMARPYAGPPLVTGPIDDILEEYEVILELAKLQAFDNGNDFVLGVTAEGVIPSAGLAERAVGAAIVQQGGGASLTVAHELGHLTGRQHNNTVASLSDSKCYFSKVMVADWPYVDSKIQDWGVVFRNGQWELLDANAHYDLMSYCDDRWISGYTYTGIASHFGIITSLAAPAAAGDYYVISGKIFSNDTAELEPTYTQYNNEPLLPPAGTTYCMEAQNASSAVLSSHCFDLDFEHPATGELADVDIFTLMLPQSSLAKRLVLRKGAQELAVQTISPNTPTVTITSPTSSSTVWPLNTDQTITWTGSDADGDTLYYTVMYSADATFPAPRWLPLATNITATQLTINTATLPGANTARCRIRILATDGVNTFRRDSVLFRSTQHPPEATIVWPETSEITITQGTPVVFEGYGFDMEDLEIGEGDYDWSSNLDGRLSISRFARGNRLSLGQHTITFKVFDNYLVAGTAAFTVNVVPPTSPKTPVLQSPSDNLLTNSVSLTFSWEALTGVTGYQIQIDNNSDFSSPERTTITADLSYTASLASSGEFFWRVRGVNGSVYGPWSETRRYTLNAIISKPDPADAVPVLYRFDTPAATLAWGQLTWADEYQVQVDDSLNFSSLAAEGTVSDLAFTTPALGDGIYFWRVRARSSGGAWSAWSPPSTFAINAAP